MDWVYNGKEVKSIDDLPKDCIGFIYKITNTKTNEYYIGKKNIYQRRTLHHLKVIKEKEK